MSTNQPWNQQILFHLPKALEIITPYDAIHQVGQCALSILRSHPADVRILAHKKLYAYPFKNVPLCWRRAFEEACLWEICQTVEKAAVEKDVKRKAAMMKKVVRLCDMAIIFTGTPHRRELFDDVLRILQRECLPCDDIVVPSLEDRDDDCDAPPPKRQRLDAQQVFSADNRSTTPSDGFSPSKFAPVPNIDPEFVIPRLSQPSITYFSDHLRKTHTPLILTNTLNHWPALNRWTSPSYWLSRTHGGLRLVPVELGRSYTDSGWGQRIMDFGTYLSQHVIESAGERKGYLAQHDLLNQIPMLRNDIAVPDYCYAETGKEGEERDTEPMLNVWLGPAGTISPAHTDPHENILAQVVGRKYVRLFPPTETKRMYPMGNENNGEAESGVDMQNTSRIDVGSFVDGDEGRQEQLDRFPLHADARYVEAVLEAGECLYVPNGWWHYIRSLDISCSVSFWWD